jgi:hypothetical protein
MSPDRRGVGCNEDAPEKRTIAKKKKVAGKGFAEKEAAKKKLAATGNKTSLAWRVLGTWGTHHGFRREPVWGRTVRGSPFQLGTTRGGVGRLIIALCRCFPWSLYRRRGVHSGEDSGVQEARMWCGQGML